MTLAEFRAMWEKDRQGLRFIEEDNRQKDGCTWLLYSVVEPVSTNEYGRHYALIVVISASQQLVAHNFKNISTSQSTLPWRKQVDAWWEEHFAEGLITEDGKPIPVEA